jgi:hypothetical protein
LLENEVKMIGSVSINMSQLGVNPYSGTSRVQAPETNERHAAEASEAKTTQAREGESASSSTPTALLSNLQQNETQRIFATSTQNQQNAQATQVTGKRAYAAAGSSTFNFG